MSENILVADHNVMLVELETLKSAKWFVKVEILFAHGYKSVENLLGGRHFGCFFAFAKANAKRDFVRIYACKNAAAINPQILGYFSALKPSARTNSTATNISHNERKQCETIRKTKILDTCADSKNLSFELSAHCQQIRKRIE